MCVEQSSNLACVMLTSSCLVFRHLLSEAISESRANAALHCFELLFKAFGAGGRVLFLGLLEFAQAVPVCRDSDRVDRSHVCMGCFCKFEFELCMKKNHEIIGDTSPVSKPDSCTPVWLLNELLNFVDSG